MRRIPVFISSKQEELRADRMATAEAIGECEQFEPVYAEDWAPQRAKPSAVYTEDALRCPIYVGIFWRTYSEHTEREYDAAASNPQTELLLYKKNCIEAERDEPLRSLLKRCQTNHVCRAYGEAVELRQLLPKHLLATVTRMIARLHALGSARSAHGPRATHIRNSQLRLIEGWGLSLEPEGLEDLLQRAAGRLQGNKAGNA